MLHLDTSNWSPTPFVVPENAPNMTHDEIMEAISNGTLPAVAAVDPFRLQMFPPLISAFTVIREMVKEKKSVGLATDDSPKRYSRTVVFDINEQQFRFLSHTRPPLLLILQSQRARGGIVEWPRNVCVKFNSVVLLTDEKMGPNRGSSVPLSRYLNSGKNILEISCVGATSPQFLFGVVCVQRYSSRQLLKLASEVNVLPKDLCQEKVEALMKGDFEKGIVQSSATISFRCVYSHLPIRIPAKGTACLHIQCFDLENFVRMNERTCKWMCPICQKSCPFSETKVDTYFLTMMSAAELAVIYRSSTSSDIEEGNFENENMVSKIPAAIMRDISQSSLTAIVRARAAAAASTGSGGPNANAAMDAVSPSRSLPDSAMLTSEGSLDVIIPKSQLEKKCPVSKDRKQCPGCPRMGGKAICPHAPAEPPSGLSVIEIDTNESPNTTKTTSISPSPPLSNNNLFQPEPSTSPPPEVVSFAPPPASASASASGAVISSLSNTAANPPAVRVPLPFLQKALELYRYTSRSSSSSSIDIWKGFLIQQLILWRNAGTVDTQTELLLNEIGNALNANDLKGVGVGGTGPMSSVIGSGIGSGGSGGSMMTSIGMSPQPYSPVLNMSPAGPSSPQGSEKKYNTMDIARSAAAGSNNQQNKRVKRSPASPPPQQQEQQPIGDSSGSISPMTHQISNTFVPTHTPLHVSNITSHSGVQSSYSSPNAPQPASTSNCNNNSLRSIFLPLDPPTVLHFPPFAAPSPASISPTSSPPSTPSTPSTPLPSTTTTSTTTTSGVSVPLTSLYPNMKFRLALLHLVRSKLEPRMKEIRSSSSSSSTASASISSNVDGDFPSPLTSISSDGSVDSKESKQLMDTCISASYELLEVEKQLRKDFHTAVSNEQALRLRSLKAQQRESTLQVQQDFSDLREIFEKGEKEIPIVEGAALVDTLSIPPRLRSLVDMLSITNIKELDAIEKSSLEHNAQINVQESERAKRILHAHYLDLFHDLNAAKVIGRKLALRQPNISLEESCESMRATIDTGISQNTAVLSAMNMLVEVENQQPTVPTVPSRHPRQEHQQHVGGIMFEEISNVTNQYI